MRVRAKMKCASVTKYEGSCESVALCAVYGPGNEEWSRMTPSGDLKLSITNPDLMGAFAPGKVYFIDIVETDTP